MPPKISKYKLLLKDLNYVDDVNDNSMVQNLLRAPKNDKSYEASITFCPTAEYIQQVDVLFLPEDMTPIAGDKERCKQEFKRINEIRKRDKLEPFKKENGYRYLLVAVDIATGKCDPKCLKYKFSFIVRDALKRIYARKIINVPHEIEVDAGSEFKDEFYTYFESISHVRRKKAGRHRAQAVVEGLNSLVSKLVQTRMLSEELNTNQTSMEWVEEIPEIIKIINKHFAHSPHEIDVEKHIPIKVKKDTLASDIVEEGTKVRIQLDNPVDAVETKRLNGSFRIGDIRWSKDIKTVTQVYLRPDQPPMYEIDNDDNVAYTRNQLQVVKSDEKRPNSKLQQKIVIDEILERIKRGNKIFFKVKWSDGDITEEPRNTLHQDVAGLVEEFEEMDELQPVIINSQTDKKKLYYMVQWKDKSITKESKTELNKRFPTLIENYENKFTSLYLTTR
jgi:hypothetical protein